MYVRWNWEYDPVSYHDWPTLIQELASNPQGPIAMLGYINPYLVNVSGRDPSEYTHNYFQEVRLACLFLDNVGFAYQKGYVASGLIPGC